MNYYRRVLELRSNRSLQRVVDDEEFGKSGGKFILATDIPNTKTPTPYDSKKNPPQPQILAHFDTSTYDASLFQVWYIVNTTPSDYIPAFQ